VPSRRTSVAGLSSRRLGFNHRPGRASLWWTKWHLGRFFSECFGVLQSSHQHQSTTLCNLSDCQRRSIIIVIKTHYKSRWQPNLCIMFQKAKQFHETEFLSRRLTFIFIRVHNNQSQNVILCQTNLKGQAHKHPIYLISSLILSSVLHSCI